jgi:hypothetical protein
MKLYELFGMIAAIVGILGFVLSLYNLWRSKRSDERVHSLAFAQKKQEALGMILNGEAASRTVQSQIWELRHDAYMVGAGLVVNSTDKLAANCSEDLNHFNQLRKEVEALDSSKAGYDELLMMADKLIIAIRARTDTKRIEQEVAGHIADGRKYIAALMEAKLLGIDPDKI